MFIKNIMKLNCSIFISIVLLTLLFHSLSIKAPSKQSYSPPCCNLMDPRITTGRYFTLDCATGHLPAVDSQCCVNLWIYFNGPPPATVSCYAEGMFCPEEFQ